MKAHHAESNVLATLGAFLAAGRDVVDYVCRKTMAIAIAVFGFAAELGAVLEFLRALCAPSTS